MGINLVTFYESTVTPQDDALIYENALPGSGMIYGGNVTIKNANTLHVTAGHGALCGRKFTIEETDVPVQLTSSGTLNGRLYIHMDLSNVDEPITLEVERASTLTPPVQQSNVNITDGIFEINLATFQISTSTISNLVYVAPFIHYVFLKEVIIAPVEKTNVASQDYVVGRHLVLNNILYKVTAAITAGQTIAVGTNVAVSDDVEKQIETNLSSINTINNYKLNQTVIATRQANLTASKAYVVGEQFIYNNTLYEVTAAISKNAAITIGGNCKTADTITSQISNFVNLFTAFQILFSSTTSLSVSNINTTYVNSSGHGCSKYKIGQLVFLAFNISTKSTTIPAGTKLLTINNTGILNPNDGIFVAGHGWNHAVKINLSRNSSNTSNTDLTLAESYNDSSLRGFVTIYVSG